MSDHSAAEDLRERLGASPEDIARDLDRFAEAARVLSSDHPRLIDEYPQQWVAIHRGEVRAHGADMRAVIEQIEQMGLSPRQVIVRFIDRNRRTMIL